jgi:phosphoribosylanthranilate isomerase
VSWIKICGITTPAAVEAARQAQVDAIGFVFAPSTRRVTPEAAARLATAVRGALRLVAVTRHPTQWQVDEILRELKPDALQSDSQDLQALRLPRSLTQLPVLRTGDMVPEPLPARVLYEGPASGKGIVCDWSAAHTLARRTQLVIAGGLTEQNVATAIAEVRPFGVDVSSGVETGPGIKSPEKILKFAAAARAAWQALAHGRPVGERHK